MTEAAERDQYVAAQGERAKRELNLTDEAFDKLRATLFEEIAATAPEQVAKREFFYAQLRTLKQVREALVSVVNAGHIANARLSLAEQGLLRP